MPPTWLTTLQILAEILWQGAFGVLVIVAAPKLWSALRVWQEVSTAQLRAERDVERAQRQALEATLSRTSLSFHTLEKERESLTRQLERAADAGAQVALLGPTGSRANLVGAVADLILVAVRLDIMAAMASEQSRRASGFLDTKGNVRIGANALNLAIKEGVPKDPTIRDMSILVGLQLATPLLLEGGPEAVVKTIHSLAQTFGDSADIIKEAAVVVARSEAYGRLRALGSTLHRPMTVALSFDLPTGAPEFVSFGNGLVFDSRRRTLEESPPPPPTSPLGTD